MAVASHNVVLCYAGDRHRHLVPRLLSARPACLSVGRIPLFTCCAVIIIIGGIRFDRGNNVIERDSQHTRTAARCE